jgi:alkylation response protein AidB-like acyl-CoA dehydrogenase
LLNFADTGWQALETVPFHFSVAEIWSKVLNSDLLRRRARSDAEAGRHVEELRVLAQHAAVWAVRKALQAVLAAAQVGQACSTRTRLASKEEKKRNRKKKKGARHCTTLTRRPVLLQTTLWIEGGIVNGIVNGGGGFPSDESGIFKGGLRGLQLQSVFCTHARAAAC